MLAILIVDATVVLNDAIGIEQVGFRCSLGIEQVGNLVVNKVAEGKGGFGYNADKDKYEDLIAIGVIDPVKVTRIALQNAASVAGLLLTTDCE